MSSVGRGVRASEMPNEDEEEKWRERINNFLTEIGKEFLNQPEMAMAEAEEKPSVKRLREYIHSHIRDLPSSETLKLTGTFSQLIYSPLHTTAGYVYEKQAALVACVVLIDLDEGLQSGVAMTRIINSLKAVLDSNEVLLLNLASLCLGKLVRTEGTLASECAHNEAQRALKWLETAERRSVAVNILKELAHNAPTSFYIHTNDFLQKMWLPLKDRSQALRESTAECLAVTLALIDERADTEKLRAVYAEALQNIREPRLTNEALHGALLVINALLLSPGLGDVHLTIFSTVFGFREHRDKLIRSCFIAMIPRMCACSRLLFAEKYLNDASDSLLAALRIPEFESIAFTAIGEMFHALADEQFLQRIAPIVDKTTVLIKAALQPKRGHPTPSIFSCIELIAKTGGSAFLAQMLDILPVMFVSSPLTPEFAAALHTLSVQLPSLLPDIQDRLLNLIAQTLASQPFHTLNESLARLVGGRGPAASAAAAAAATSVRPIAGGRSTRRGGTQSSAQRKSSLVSGAGFIATDQTILMALRILCTFDFETHNLTCFVREVVLGFLDTEYTVAIRKQAALAAIRIAVHPGENAPTSGKYAAVVADIIEKLLDVGVTDQIDSIRNTIFASLDERYDSHLGAAENLQSLFLALNDERFSIREQAISIIGRLAVRNPAYVMPSLRKALIELVTELDFSQSLRIQEECCRLLISLFKSAGRLMRPYVSTILAALIPKLRDPSKRVIATILAACGELSVIASEELRPHMTELFSLAVGCLADQGSAQRRLTALRAIRQFCQHLGYVIQPYFDFPNLMSILTAMFKTEASGDIRHELLAVLGVLGAVDPHQLTAHALRRRARQTTSSKGQQQLEGVYNPLDKNMTLTPEFYSGEVLKELMRLFADGLTNLHEKIVHMMIHVCKLLGHQSGKFLPQIMPLFIDALNSSNVAYITSRKYFIQQLGILIHVTSSYAVAYLESVCAIVKSYWHDAKLKEALLILIEKMATTLPSEIKAYLPSLLPLLLTSLHSDTQDRIRVLSLLDTLGASLDDYVHLVIPSVVKLFDTTTDAQSDEVVCAAADTIAKLCTKLALGCYASRITHPLLRILSSSSTSPALQTQALNTISTLVFQLGSDYATFIPLINRTMTDLSIRHSQYETLVSCLLKNQPMTQPNANLTADAGAGGAGAGGAGGGGGASRSFTISSALKPAMSMGAYRSSAAEGGVITASSSAILPDDPAGASSSSRRKLHAAVPNLRKVWDTSSVSTREDWVTWIRRLSVELIRESPSQAMRNSLPLAQFHYPFARALFNASFIACWSDLEETDRQQLSRHMRIALGAKNAPPEIIQTILDLAERIEHYGITLTIEPQLLGSVAQKSRAYAKALHYKELSFKSATDADSIESDTIQALISINNMLGQPDAARGILAWTKNQTDDQNIQESWYESLHRWEDALASWDHKQRENPGSNEATIGRMRCLDALGDWDRLALLVQSSWPSASPATKQEIAPMATVAVWNLGRWKEMEEYVKFIPATSADGAFYRAVLALHENRPKRVSKFIAHARNLLYTDLTALFGESYHRAYHVVCRVQQLSELEEAAEYKNSAVPDRQTMLRKIWRRRLLGCQRSVDVWQRILPVRSLVLTPHENIDMSIKFASLCRKANRMRVSHNILIGLLGGDPTETPSVEISADYPAVTYAYLKHAWFANAKLKPVVLGKMKSFVELIPKIHRKLRSKTYLKIGSMELELVGDRLNSSNIPSIAAALKEATNCNPEWHRAWHAWSLLNFEAISIFEKTGETTRIAQHLSSALRGFFRSITLCLSAGYQTLQDTLRLITLWFKYGGHAQAEAALREGFGLLSIDNWLQVIPQIIARIHSRIPEVRKLVKELLHQVGRLHPQALVYPLTVAIGSQSGDGLDAASELLDSMREHSANLVEQAMLVSKELIRVSIVWPEQWHEALEDASRAFFTEKNPAGMIERLQPMHETLDLEPQTLREQAFYLSFARDLLEARNWCRRYLQTGVVQDLNAAWDLYYGVFRAIDSRLLPRLKLLDLHLDSPQLLAATDLELAIPGSYVAGRPIVRIRGFHPLLTVFSSKQRPRKMTISGSNGEDFNFLLKGHEDLRQDERVMQLFGLVNNLLAEDHDTSRYHLSVIRYAAVPLSPNSGLIGWVPNTDTLHDVIKEYRQAQGMALRCEQVLMGKLYDKYDQLNLIQKVEVFFRSLEASDGLDISKSLWSSSPNSEVWLDRRTNYTRSIALMSMVGYILGLGDRHPSNLMIERHTGKVLHIDFGDCFEVAMVRDKYPETVPFRLTRMLVNAMEVSGIEGNYRSTCESVMRVLRDSRESLMAVLEAFVYDPLINWRLLAKKQASLDQVEGDGNEPAVEELVKSNEDDPFLSQIETEEKDKAPDQVILGSVFSRSSTRTESAAASDVAESALNARAVQVIERVSSKLRGTDFLTPEPLDVPDQVSRLIEQARSPENLCLLYAGWSACW